MSGSTIAAVNPSMSFDSRGTPTVSCEVRLDSGATGTVRAPSGASTGTHEAVELRDGDERFDGKGVQCAIKNIGRVIAPAVVGLDATDQAGLDQVLEELDGTGGFSNLGSNAVLPVSLGAGLACAENAGVAPYVWFGNGNEPLLPVPMVNIISGGVHAKDTIDVQDLLAIPVSATSFAEAIEHVWRIRESTRKVLASYGYSAMLVADEGGFGPSLPSNVAALEVFTEAIERSGLRGGSDIAIGLDFAANQFATQEGYWFGPGNRQLTAEELVDEIDGWCSRYPVISLEDILADHDWAGWQCASQRLAAQQLVGDDLFVTQHGLLQRGVDYQVANAVLIKLNQAGTVTRTQQTMELAEATGYATVLSARSGDTEDSWLADLAVGWRTGQIKVGSLSRSERLAKWNRLLTIEATLGSGATYAGAVASSGLPGGTT